MSLGALLGELAGRIRPSASARMTALKSPPREGTPGSFPGKDYDLVNDEDLTLDHNAQDWKKSPAMDTEEQRQIVNFVKSCFESSYRARQEMELEWALATAFFEGRQWMRIASQTRNLISLQNPSELSRYITIQKMRPLIDGVVGKLTQVSPDAYAIPLSDSVTDRDAADEANIICNHFNRKFKRETQLKERVRWACVCGTSYLKVYWDAKGVQTVPFFNPMTGEIDGYQQMAIGDVREEILPAFDVFVDPTAKRDEDIRFMIHASVRPLSWFVDNYGDNGKRVTADAISGANGSYVDAYLEGGNGSGNGWVPASTARLGQIESRRRAAIVYEYWEKPNEQYPEGRYIVSTNTCLLYAGDWLYEKRDEFPFIPLRWQPRSGTTYGYSLGFDLCPLQQTYNRIYSRMQEQFENQKDYVMIQKLSGIGADAFNNQSDDVEDATRIYRKIYYNQASAPPVIARAPGIGQDLYPMLQMLEKDMMDIAGLHDVSQGMAQAGTPAESVRLLQRADNTQHSYIRADIEISNAKIKEWEVALTAQFGVAPFVGQMEERKSPADELRSGVITFDHIRKGGQYRIEYVPGSAQDDSPDQKLQKLMAFRQMGLFGDPADPTTNMLVIKMLKLPETSMIMEHLQMQDEKVQQMQEFAMQQAQMQAQPKPSEFDPEAEQMRTQLDITKIQAQQGAKLEADITKMRERSKLLQENDAAKSMVSISQKSIEQNIFPQDQTKTGNK
jgi:hypothetical protein